MLVRSIAAVYWSDPMILIKTKKSCNKSLLVVSDEEQSGKL